MIRKKDLIDLLAKILYEVKVHRVSVDVAFKRVCKGVCVKGLDEREELYRVVREFISDYHKIMCYVGGDISYREVARVWLDRKYVVPETPYCMYSYPKWFVDELLKVLSLDELVEVLKAMNERVWWLRINTLLSPEERVLRDLESEGVDYEVFKEVPYMVRVLSSRKPVRLLKVVREFKAVPQDLSSAVVVESLRPAPNDYVVDLAAAPGMKTSLVMMLTENKARIIACDKSLRRLTVMKGLLRRLGVDLSRVTLVYADSTHLSFRGFDKALVDAPCSNSGAIGKDPGIKISLTKGKVIRNCEVQLKMLRNAVRLADYVVFSTCSILPDEGEFIISKLGVNDFKLLKPVGWVGSGYPVVSFYNSVMRLMPHRHSCEGFFIAVLTLK